MAGSEAPPFWFREPGWQSLALSPIAAIYGAIAARRLHHAKPVRVCAPVLCIGNLTVGGTGKTPTALAMAQAAKALKYTPGFVTRGYGGSHVLPHLVNIEKDTHKSVGDEPLLLARAAPTIIGRNRAASAKKLIEQGVDFIIMDDGFQSRSLHYDFALITVDARRGIGNGKVIPAGPLRAALVDQMRHTDALLHIGDGNAADVVIRYAARAGRPVKQAYLAPANVREISRKRVYAFCGIGDPEKFYNTLSDFGCQLIARRSFGDHHVFSETEAEQLLAKAQSEGLELVTTEKDAVRLSHSQGPLARLREAAHVLPVSLKFETKTEAAAIIEATAESYHHRIVSGG